MHPLMINNRLQTLTIKQSYNGLECSMNQEKMSTSEEIVENWYLNGIPAH